MTTQNGRFILNISSSASLEVSWKQSVAYLVFFQKGGGKCSLATSAHTKGGLKQVFQFFQLCQKNLLAKGGGMADLAKG